jgi:hypothetical protein
VKLRSEIGFFLVVVPAATLPDCWFDYYFEKSITSFEKALVRGLLLLLAMIAAALWLGIPLRGRDGQFLGRVTPRVHTPDRTPHL